MGFNLKGLYGMALLMVLGLIILVEAFWGETDMALIVVDSCYLGKSDPLCIYWLLI